MPRLLMQASAFLCALSVALVAFVLTNPTAIEAIAEVVALGFLGFAVLAGRHSKSAMLAALLAAFGLLMIVFTVPAEAATVAHRVLGVVEAPVQPLALAAPTPPQQVVVSVAEPAASSVAVPIGQWLSLAQGTLASLLMAALAAVLAKLPKPVAWALKLYGEDKLINQAIALAVNAVPGAAKGVPLTVDVGSSVLAHGLQWIIDTVPGFVVASMGGEDSIKGKLFAAMHLEPAASAAAMGVKATA